MRFITTTYAVCLLLSAAVHGQPPKPAPEPPTLTELQTNIDNAIHRGVDAILRTQQADGSWSDNQYAYPVGPTALCTYALLKCGLKTDHPAVKRALRFLEGNLSNKTYGAACQLMAFEATKDKRYKPLMKELLHRLLEWQRGGWGYPHGAVDLSNTQYGALGLRAARIAGIKVPRRALIKLIEHTFHHQQEPELKEIPPDPVQEPGYARSGGPGKVAGFGYRGLKTDRASQKATGSMTTAGLGILLIGQELLDDKMARSLRKKFDRSMEQGLNWMRVNWAVNRNPGGSWHLYYLYGLERVGDLMRREVMAGRLWYREGAAHLLKKQTKDGKWGGNPQTSFGLLFLKRATWLGAVTGAGGTDRNQRVYLAASDAAEVELRAAGNPKLSMWIAGFNQKKLAKRFPKAKGKGKDKREMRVAQVDYLLDGKVIHSVKGDIKAVWDGEPFSHRHIFQRCGRYNIAARVHIRNPDAALAGEADTVLLESPLLIVEVLDLPDPDADALSESLQKNKLSRLGWRVTASSIQNGWPRGNPWISDGRLVTSWLCKANDKNPSIKIVSKHSVKCEEIVLWPNQIHQKIKKIEVVLNGGGRPKIIDVTDPRAPIHIPFKRRINLTELEIKITETDPKSGNRHVGFAEVIVR